MLVVQDKKALLLNLSSPSRVLNAIPSAQHVRDGITLVPHGSDETRVLRNLGVQAPAPIHYYYKWRGRYTPYSHQKQTSAFLTLNKKALLLSEIGCVDSETEYLSPTGWQKISEYSGGKVAQYWPDTGIAEFVEPGEYVKKPCRQMIRFKTGYGVDQLLSPEHRVLYVDSGGNKKVTSAESVLEQHKENRLGWKGRIITTFSGIGRDGINISNEALRVQVAVMADGHIPPNCRSNRCTLRLKKPRKKERLRALLTEAGIQWSENSNETRTATGFTAFSFVAPIRSKSYAEWAWQATNEQLKIIADEAPHWDGSHRKAGAVEFFTRDKSSADFMQYAFAATGRTASISTLERKDKIDYVVHARKNAALLYVCGQSDNEKTDTIYEQEPTDGYKYCFVVPSTYLILRRNGCIFATGNTGKTISALWAADFLMEQGLIRKVLIISPLSTLERVWGDSLFTNFTNRTYTILYGTAEKRKKLLQAPADFYIINHDGFAIIADQAKDMFDLIIVDEAAVLRNPSTTRFKTLWRFMRDQPDTRLWLMTGTPTPNEPTDAWALAKLVESPALTSTYSSFRDKVMMKVGQWRWVPRPNSPETVAAVLQPSIRFARDECLDLPSTVFQTREAQLTAQQKTYYKEMMKNLVVEASQGHITAANEAVKMQKLIQIACGAAYDENGNTIELDCSPRINLVEELIEECGGKAIVFVPLTGVLHMLDRELSKKFTVSVVYGDVPARERADIFRRFQNETDPRVIIAHPATMAHGLTLTASSTIIWYSAITSNEQYTQANGRIERIGKHHVSNVIHIESTDLERKVFDRLRNKQKLQGVLLDILGGE